MAGIRVTDRNGESLLHPAVWADPEEVPVVFIGVKQGATALVHPDYIDGQLFDVDHGDLSLAETWDFLMVKTPTMPHPEICRVRLLTGTGGGAEILVGGLIVHRFKGVGE